jgi:hypothetical protein
MCPNLLGPPSEVLIPISSLYMSENAKDIRNYTSKRNDVVAFWTRCISGSPVRIHLSGTDRLLCPICAVEQDITDSDLLGYLWDATCSCMSCKTRFGIDDLPDVPDELEHLRFYQMEEWDKLRMKWLEKHDWDPSLVKRVEMSFGIKIDVPGNDKDRV